MEDILINLLSLLIFFILYLIFKKFLPSYADEKGKNQATKEDIEEITSLVQGVESKVNVLTNSIIDYTSLKRQYIIDYFAAYNNWERTITSANLKGFGNWKEDNEKNIERFYDAKHSYNLKEGEIELFIEEAEFYEQRRDLTIKTLEFQHRYEQANDDLITLELNKESNPNYREDVIKLLNVYRKTVVPELKEIFIERRKVIELLDSYIKKLME